MTTETQCPWAPTKQPLLNTYLLHEGIRFSLDYYCPLKVTKKEMICQRQKQEMMPIQISWRERCDPATCLLLRPIPRVLSTDMFLPVQLTGLNLASPSRGRS